MGLCVKGLTVFQVDNSNHSSFVNFLSTVTPSQKATRMIRYDLPLVKPYWMPQITSLSCKCFGIASRRVFSMIFPGTNVRLTDLLFPRTFFLPFFKVGMVLLFFQSPGASPECQDF